jgi:hypothetical protein
MTDESLEGDLGQPVQKANAASPLHGHHIVPRSHQSYRGEFRHWI